MARFVPASSKGSRVADLPRRTTWSASNADVRWLILLCAFPARANRTAVCLTGTPRTFTRPHVFRSISENLLLALNRTGAVDLFVVLSLQDAPPKNQSGFSFTRVDAPAADVAAALAQLAPRARSTSRARGGDARARRALAQRCRFRGFLGASLENFARSLAQPAKWSACYAMLARAEAEDGARYEWVVRARPDAYWFGAHPPLRALDRGARDGVPPARRLALRAAARARRARDGRHAAALPRVCANGIADEEQGAEAAQAREPRELDEGDDARRGRRYRAGAVPARRRAQVAARGVGADLRIEEGGDRVNTTYEARTCAGRTRGVGQLYVLVRLPQWTPLPPVLEGRPIPASSTEHCCLPGPKTHPLAVASLNPKQEGERERAQSQRRCS